MWPLRISWQSPGSQHQHTVKCMFWQRQRQVRNALGVQRKSIPTHYTRGRRYTWEAEREFFQKEYHRDLFLKDWQGLTMGQCGREHSTQRKIALVKAQKHKRAWRQGTIRNSVWLGYGIVENLLGRSQIMKGYINNTKNLDFILKEVCRGVICMLFININMYAIYKNP